jgi:hypothetical protein
MLAKGNWRPSLVSLQPLVLTEQPRLERPGTLYTCAHRRRGKGNWHGIIGHCGGLETATWRKRGMLSCTSSHQAEVGVLVQAHLSTRWSLVAGRGDGERPRYASKPVGLFFRVQHRAALVM